MRCPKSRQEGEGGGDKQCQCASCLTDAVQESNIWQVFKYQLGGRIELSSLFTWEASYHIMKETGMIFQPLLTIHFPYSLLANIFISKNKPLTVMNRLKYIAFHRQTWRQAVKVTKEAWKRTRVTGKACTYYEKLLDNAEEKLAKMHWKNWSGLIITRDRCVYFPAALVGVAHGYSPVMVGLEGFKKAT